MYFIYSLLLTLGFIILLPRFALDALRAGKYVTGLSERLGNIPRIQTDIHRPIIWLHCVSVGETEAARSLVQALREKFPAHRLAISTTTVTGQQVARRAFAKDATAIFYFPIDWRWTVRRTLRALNPSALLIMETELWPNLLHECRRRSIPVALVNGRVSDKSLGRYRFALSFMRRVLRDLSMAVMQTDTDAARIRALGVRPQQVVVAGNLKFDSADFSDNDAGVIVDLRNRFGLDASQRVIIAASTHEPEEKIVIDAFKQMKAGANGQGLRLILVPRHPERFDEVANLLNASGLIYSRRSFAPSESDIRSEAILLDSIGELRAAYALAQIAFVGGSIVRHGGHNVLEPAAQSICVVTGRHMQNFTEITKTLLGQDAIVQLPDVSTAEAPRLLASTLDNLLSDDVRRRAIAERARKVCEQNCGVTERTISSITALLSKSQTISESVPFSALSVTSPK